MGFWNMFGWSVLWIMAFLLLSYWFAQIDYKEKSELSNITFWLGMLGMAIGAGACLGFLKWFGLLGWIIGIFAGFYLATRVIDFIDPHVKRKVRSR